MAVGINSAAIATSPLITWSDTTLFDGYVIIALSLPTGWVTAALANLQPWQQIGKRFKVKITSGMPDTSTRLYYTSSLTPPGCRYAIYWYDTEGTPLYSPYNPQTELYAVTSSPFTLPSVTLTKPAIAASLPTL